MTKVYLSGPIFDCTDSEAKDWREAVKTKLPDTLDPLRHGYKPDAYVRLVEADKRDIVSCDVVLVYCPQPSVGTSMEMLYAWQLGKRVVVVCRPNLSLSPWLRYHAHKIVATFDEAIEWIKKEEYP